MLTPPVMLFAAGRGTRMAPLTDKLPKPMIAVAGRPLLDHALALVRDAALPRVVANTHYLADIITPALIERGVTPVHEPELLETGGGLRNALPALGAGPVMTLNTDAVWTGDNPVPAMLRAWDGDRMDGLLLILPRECAKGHRGTGDFDMSGDGRLKRGKTHVYTGVQILNPEGLAAVPRREFSLNLAWDRMLAQDRLFGMIHTGGWCDVGRPESIALAETLLKADSDV